MRSPHQRWLNAAGPPQCDRSLSIDWGLVATACLPSTGRMSRGRLPCYVSVVHRPRRGGNFSALVLSITIFGWQGAGVCAPHDVINRPDWGIGGFRPPPRWEVQAPD